MNDVGRWLKACLLLSTLATAVCAHARASSADELVKFDSAPYILGQLQQRRAIERGEMAMPTTNAIEGYLSKPDGEGPFPAVVYLHGCGGLGKAARTRFSDLLTPTIVVTETSGASIRLGIAGARGLVGRRQASCFARLLGLPWIEQCNTGGLEVCDVTSNDCQTVNQCGRGDQSITFGTRIGNMKACATLRHDFING